MWIIIFLFYSTPTQALLPPREERLPELKAFTLHSLLPWPLY